MKRFYALLLSFTLVLGFAAVASAADLKITGEFEAIGTFASGDWQGLDYDAATLAIKLSSKMGDNATGDLTLSYDYFNRNGGGLESTANHWWVSAANFTYNITDQIYAGFQFAERSNGRAYRLYKAGDYVFDNTVDDIYFDNDCCVYAYETVKAGLKFDGGEVTVWTDLNPNGMSFWGKGSYALDALKFAGWLGYDNGHDVLKFVGSVGYDITDELNVTGFIGDLEGEFAVGATAKYAVEDLATVEGRVEFDPSNYWFVDTIYDYSVKATLTMIENLEPWAKYDDDDGFSAGADYSMGASTLSAEYVVDDEELTIGLDIVF